MKHPEPSLSEIFRLVTEARSVIFQLKKLLPGDKLLELEDWYYVTRSIDCADDCLQSAKLRYEDALNRKE